MTGRLVFGVGINDASYAVQIKETVGYEGGKQRRRLAWVCPFYQVWKSILMRGHCEGFKRKWPTYADVFVCREWHRFSSFKSWMEAQDWKGKQIDKDLLVAGNKEYHPDKCVFISGRLNNFLTEHGAGRGEWPIGVCWHGRFGKFRAQVNDGVTRKHLGYFTCQDAAHDAWLQAKLRMATELAAEESDPRIANALVARYAASQPQPARSER